jgi:hypothetical protein
VSFQKGHLVGLHRLMIAPAGWVRWLVVGLATGGQMNE